MSETQDVLENSELIPLSNILISYTDREGFKDNVLSALTLESYRGNTASYADDVKDILNANPEISTIFSVRKSFESLDSKYRNQIFVKIKNSGILNLVEQIGGIREFAKKRFAKAQDVRRISSRC